MVSVLWFLFSPACAQVQVLPLLVFWPRRGELAQCRYCTTYFFGFPTGGPLSLLFFFAALLFDVRGGT